MSSATTSKETRNRFKGVNFNINIDEVEKEIEKLPQKPSLKRNTDGTYHKLDDKKQYEVCPEYISKQPFILKMLSVFNRLFKEFPNHTSIPLTS